jgi:hypothetical protein
LAFKETELSLHQHMASILSAGLAAPSADNRHTIRFDVLSDREVAVWGTPEYYAAGYQRRALTQVSLGAVIENIVIRAASLQKKVDVTTLLDSHPSRPLVRLVFDTGARPDAELDAAIAERHTNRAIVFRGPALSAQTRGEIEALVADDQSQCRLAWCGEKLDRRQVLKLVRIAEAERFRVQNQHGELFGSIRFDVGWKETCEVGLPPGALGVETFLRAPFRALGHWPVMRTLDLVGAHHLMGIRAGYLPCALAPDVGVVLAPNESPQSLFAAGRVFQRVWLKLTAMGRAFQPFAASALFALRDNDAVTPAFRSQLRSDWNHVTGGETPVIVFRTGLASPPPVRTSRLPLQQHLA